MLCDKCLSRCVYPTHLTSASFLFPVGANGYAWKAAAVVVDFYLNEEERREQRAHILQLVRQDDAESAELLLGYVREALRLSPPVSGPPSNSIQFSAR